MSQFQKVSCKYGAPMGRGSYGLAALCAPHSVRLFRVNIDSGGYDDGGAYWGIGEPIYCATDDADYFQTVRASNRTHAALLLDIERDRLKAGLKVLGWLRYSAVRAYIGLHPAATVWEISEFGKPIGYVHDWFALCHFAQAGEGLHSYTKA